jgi:SAM-dependent methyltransferase
MPSVMWEEEIAQHYDATSAVMFLPAVLDPTIDALQELVGDGRALEFAIGTGRVGLALSARGVPVAGLEYSPPMVEQLRAKPGAANVPVTIGDMKETRVPGTFALVFLVYNTIMNVTTQDEQVAVFANAAAHLSDGGFFVVEVVVPQIRKLPPGEFGRVFTREDNHVGFETFDDVEGQISWSHHWMEVDGKLIRHSAPYRYVWPAELDLMAKLAGLRLHARWSGWDQAPFTSDSVNHIAVYKKVRASS